MVVIVISGMPASGSSTIAKLLAKKLKLKHFSVGDYYKKKATQSGIKERETNKATKFLHTKEGSDKNFHINIDDLQREIAKKGNVVIDGKLSIKMLEGLYDYSVWLKASNTVRAERITGRDNIILNDAIKTIKERDKTERDAFMKIYGFDTFSQEGIADIVIDTQDKTPQKIIEVIISKMKNSNK